MNEDETRTADRFLGDLEDELAELPVGQRGAIVDDVRAHIVDARDTGRSLEDVLKGLGAAGDVARQYRDELSLPADAPRAAERAFRALHLAAVAVGVVTAVFVAFLLPTFTGQISTSDSTGLRAEQDVSTTLAQRYGFGVALLTLVPTVFAILPLVLPHRARQPVAIANATLMTLFTMVSEFMIGGFYVPMALMMWAAVIVPWRVDRGPDLAAAPTWRIVGGIAVALPALLAITGWSTGTVSGEWGLVVVIVAVLALGVLFGFGFRLAYAGVALAGAALMVFALIDSGFLILALWWFGGGWLALGLAALTVTRRGGGAGRARRIRAPREAIAGSARL